MNRVKLLAGTALSFVTAGVVAATAQGQTAEATWSGKLSDSMCGADQARRRAAPSRRIAH